ncbi:MAG TPA: IclR family transcriptional regulator [Clostridia bacterium]|nr:IclR family transcriptional regulator [Clostridia bacterium]
MNKKPDKSEVTSLDKAIQILQYLTQLDKDISLKDLSAGVNMPKATLIRLLTTMKRHGLIQQDVATKNYRLGWALIYMGTAASRLFDLPKIIHPYLERLSRESGESASLVQFQRDSAVYVDQVSCTNLIRSGLGVGAQLQIHLSAAGKILISDMPDEAIRKFIKRNPLIKRTEKTITSEEAFLREIHSVRENGYALDDEEGEIGGRCIAAPIRDWNDNILASISITGPSSRVHKETMPRLIELVCEVASMASDELKCGSRQNTTN